MNNKILMSVIGAVVLILVTVLFIYAVTSLMDSGSGAISFGDNSGESSSVNESDASAGENTSEDNSSDYEFGEPNIGDDDGFEGSVITGNNYPSDESSSAESNDSSSSSNNPSSGSASNTGNPGNGNQGSGSTGSNPGSNPGSGNTSSGPTVEDVTGDGTVTYEEYIAMSGEEQQKFFDSFESVEAFFEWYNDAKAKYDAENESIEIGEDGEIDLGDIIGGNG